MWVEETDNEDFQASCCVFLRPAALCGVFIMLYLKQLACTLSLTSNTTVVPVIIIAYQLSLSRHHHARKSMSMSEWAALKEHSLATASRNVTSSHSRTVISKQSSDTRGLRNNGFVCERLRLRAASSANSFVCERFRLQTGGTCPESPVE